MVTIHSFLREIADNGFFVREKGTCMSPCLGDGSPVRIAVGRLFLPGDILAYCDNNQRMVLHRLIGYYRCGGRWRLLLRADSARRPDRGITGERVLGKAIDVEIPLRHRVWSALRYTKFAIGTVWTKRQPTDRKRVSG